MDWYEDVWDGREEIKNKKNAYYTLSIISLFYTMFYNRNTHSQYMCGVWCVVYVIDLLSRFWFSCSSSFYFFLLCSLFVGYVLVLVPGVWLVILGLVANWWYESGRRWVGYYIHFVFIGDVNFMFAEARINEEEMRQNQWWRQLFFLLLHFAFFFGLNRMACLVTEIIGGLGIFGNGIYLLKQLGQTEHTQRDW